MKKITTIVLVSSFISACSGSGSEFQDNSTPVTGLSIIDIAGVWDTSEVVGQEIDESYLIIDQDGITQDYDYRGDSYNNGQNCYRKRTGSINNLGNSTFETIDSEGFRVGFSMSVANNELTSNVVSINGIAIDDFIEQNSIPEEDFTKLFVSVKSTLQETDFVPLCTD